MPSKALSRIKQEQGFTMIELLIVMIVMMILLTIAFPAYLSLRDRARDSAAKKALGDIAPALILYNGDNGGYSNVTPSKLKSAYNFDVKKVSIFLPTQTSYCLKAKVGVRVWYKVGPAGIPTQTKPVGPCP